MITSEIIKNAVYNLCVEANTVLPDDVFAAIFDAYKNETSLESKQALHLILKNAKLSYEMKKPLCQDTGQVLVFVRIGEKAQVENLNQAINEGVSKAYEENFYRKSVVKNALFDRENTNTNTPCIIYSEVVEGEELEIELLIKGAGAENVSAVSMLSPTSSEDDVVNFVTSVVEKAGAKACPPLFIGVGIGGTMEYAGVLSKKALFGQNIDENHQKLAEKIKNAINKLKIGTAGLGGDFTALDVKVLSDFTHIASMPVAVTINCHSLRHSKCLITPNEEDELNVPLTPPLAPWGRGGEEEPDVFSEKSSFLQNPSKSYRVYNFHSSLVKNFELETEDFSDFVNVEASDVSALRNLKQGQNVLLSGEIYTARDMAHKRLAELIEKKEPLPFDLKDKIIFYAGPCPCPQGEVVGSVGPTTSSRMDKYAIPLYKAGVLATIGKGERSEDVLKTVKQVCGLYFTVIGGIACYLSTKVIKSDVVAFEELGTEAVYRLQVKDLPLRVDFC